MDKNKDRHWANISSVIQSGCGSFSLNRTTLSLSVREKKEGDIEHTAERGGGGSSFPIMSLSVLVCRSGGMMNRLISVDM